MLLYLRRKRNSISLPSGDRAIAPAVCKARPRLSLVAAIAAIGLVVMFAGLARRQAPVPPPKAVPAPSVESLNVLLISSWSDRLPWTQGLVAGLNRARELDDDFQVNLYVEYLDGARLRDAISDGEWAALFQKKYGNADIDALILDAGPAIDFGLERGRDLFGDIPLVLLPNQNMATNQLEFGAIVNLGPVVAETVALALAQNPAAEMFVIIGDRSEEAQVLIDKAVTAIRSQAPATNVEVRDDFTLDSLQGELQTLPPHSIVLFTLVFEDASGQYWRPVDVVERIAATAAAPTYVLFDSMLDTGAVGGHVQSAQQTGELALQAAQAAVERAAESAAGTLEYSVSQTILDWRALQKWRIPSRKIPADAVVLHRKPPFWEAYFQETIAAISLMALQSLSLVTLVVMFVQKQRLSRELLVANDSLELRVAERTQQLHQLTIRDDLTGLYNRKEFYRRVREELFRFERSGAPFALAIFDLDKFKAINDTYGHLGGDCVLRSFAQLLDCHTRASDIPARIGGEEFALLLPDTDKNRAIAALEALRQRVAALQVPLDDGREIGVTVSIGVAVSQPDDRAIETILQRADRRLYRAKRGGRNCTVADDRASG